MTLDGAYLLPLVYVDLDVEHYCGGINDKCPKAGRAMGGGTTHKRQKGRDRF
jgi:hypothetical protein